MLGRNHVLYVVFMLMPAYHPPIIVLKLEEAHTVVTPPPQHSKTFTPQSCSNPDWVCQRHWLIFRQASYDILFSAWYSGLSWRPTVCLHHSDNRCQSSGTGCCTVWLRSGRQIHTAKYHQILHPKINILLNKWKYSVNTTKVWLGLTEVTMQFISETDCI